ncbi:NAD(P)-dependent oxidoreductase [Aeromonas veronii]|uniref:NAD-dependent epimerase/dehydratase family protein n=1 Tax=Aeromonas veronii TaxID=654 RepID=UPI0026660B0B|nr:NAD(P)-dependent oxidoreductase [Aeromonas veronii]MDO2435635.1 NAD(P)-dependent oxidoreductase [Aeromonas veronii]
MQTILITGASGFVGKQILNAMSTAKVKLIPVVRIGKEHTVSDIINVERIISTPDLFSENEEWWYQTCTGIDAIIHAAWYAEPGKYLLSTKNVDCLVGSMNMAKGAVKAGVKHIVGIGTCFEYDLTRGFLPIDTPLKPLTPYAAAKAALYFGLLHWLPAQNVCFSWCRLFYLYGEGEDERRLVSYIRQQLARGEPVELTSGKQIRDFMDVRDAAEKIAAIAITRKEGAFNICSGIPITIREVAEKIADEYGDKTLLHFGLRPDNIIDPPIVVGVINK